LRQDPNSIHSVPQLRKISRLQQHPGMEPRLSQELGQDGWPGQAAGRKGREWREGETGRGGLEAESVGRNRQPVPVAVCRGCVVLYSVLRTPYLIQVLYSVDSVLRMENSEDVKRKRLKVFGERIRSTVSVLYGPTGPPVALGQ
jgi:hypothetical protein